MDADAWHADQDAVRHGAVACLAAVFGDTFRAFKCAEEFACASWSESRDGVVDFGEGLKCAGKAACGGSGTTTFVATPDTSWALDARVRSADGSLTFVNRRRKSASTAQAAAKAEDAIFKAHSASYDTYFREIKRVVAKVCTGMDKKVRLPPSVIVRLMGTPQDLVRFKELRAAGKVTDAFDSAFNLENLRRTKLPRPGTPPPSDPWEALVHSLERATPEQMERTAEVIRAVRRRLNPTMLF